MLSFCNTWYVLKMWVQLAEYAYPLRYNRFNEITFKKYFFFCNNKRECLSNLTKPHKEAILSQKFSLNREVQWSKHHLTKFIGYNVIIRLMWWKMLGHKLITLSVFHYEWNNTREKQRNVPYHWQNKKHHYPMKWLCTW